jgi:hypothetical protein
LCLNWNETQDGKFVVKQKSCGFAAAQQRLRGSAGDRQQTIVRAFTEKSAAGSLRSFSSSP